MENISLFSNKIFTSYSNTEIDYEILRKLSILPFFSISAFKDVVKNELISHNISINKKGDKQNENNC